MIFDPPLTQTVLLRRYKRFLADVELPHGKLLTVHCPNSGSMKTCVGDRWPACISDSRNPERKLRYTLEMVHNGCCWIGINTFLPNRLAEEAIRAGRLEALSGYDTLRREVKYGQNSRIDILASRPGQTCYIEIKNTTLIGDDGAYCFPDAVTTRGQKHLDELTEMVAQGHRAVMLYFIQRSDGTHFRPADEIDPEYGRKLRDAHAKGVEILPCMAAVSPAGIELTGEIIPYDLG